MRVSLRTKTILGVAVIESILLFILVVTAINFLTDIIDDTLTKRANSKAALFALTTKDALRVYDLASLEALSNELIHSPDTEYIRVIGADGRLLASSGDAFLIERAFSEDSELSDISDGVFDTFANITDRGKLLGRIELGLSIQSTQAKITQVRVWSAILAFLELILVTAFSYVLMSYLTRQLKILETGSRKIRTALKTRDFKNAKVVVTGEDELSELAISFNGLVESMQQELMINQGQQAQLQELNNQLEAKVAKRTESLDARNKELSKINKEMKETQRQLLQAEKMASVGQLAAGVAHEINNPVGFVSSNLTSLKDYVNSYKLLSYEVTQLTNADEEDRTQALLRLNEYVSKEDFDFIDQDATDLIDESSSGLQRVTEIVDGLKLFSRIDNDEKKLSDINECIKTTLNMVKSELKYECNIETNFQALPEIPINVGQISQVFTNLFINAGHAIKASGQFGLLTISTQVDQENVIIDVKDTGTGMSDDVITRIFNPFFTTKPEGTGTGLGLSISFGIIADHGGEMSAESKVGDGSCFTIKIPVTGSQE